MTNGSQTKPRPVELPPDFESQIPSQSIWTRITRWKRGIPARLGLVVLVALAAMVFHVPHPLTTRASLTKPGWRLFSEPKRHWTIEFPESWHAQRIAEVGPTNIYRPSAYGIFISNINRRFSRTKGSEGSGSINTMGASPSLVSIRVMWSYGGGFLMTHCEDKNTPLPLSLKKAHRRTQATGANKTPQTILSIPLIVQGSEQYSVEATLGSQASGADHTTLEQIVASISFDNVEPDYPVSRTCAR